MVRTIYIFPWDGEEGENMRGHIVITLIALLAAAAAACAGSKRGDGAVLQVIQAASSVDVGKLTDAEVRLLVKLVRKEASPCEGSVSLLEELGKPKPCPAAARALAFFYRRILDGYPEGDILDLYVSRFKNAAKVELALDGCPALGPAEASVTVVVFSDFECPFCRKAAAAVLKLREVFEDKVRVVYKHYPLTDMHPQALDAARAAEAALAQGRFWEMHDQLFALEGQLGEADLEKAAVDAGLDVERWKDDLEDDAALARIDKDEGEGKKLGIEGTPAIYVNGTEFLEPVKYLDEYVAELLGPPSEK